MSGRAQTFLDELTANGLQGMTLMAWRLSKLYEEGKMTHAMASNVKVNLRSSEDHFLRS